MELKTFTLYRLHSLGSPSGAGRVLDGVVFHNGWTVVCWRTDIDASRSGHTSLGMYPSWEAFSALHLDSRPGYESKVVFGDSAELDSRIAEAIVQFKN